MDDQLDGPLPEAVDNVVGPKWTVMVYLAGDNSLTNECVYALTEMKKALVSGRVKVFAQFDPKDDHLPTHRYEINSGGKESPLSSDVRDVSPFKHESRHHYPIQLSRGPAPQPVDETATGDGRTLFNFLSYYIETSPAEHYMVILAGHGSGTQRDYLLKDDSPSGYLTISKLKWVFDKLNEKYQDAAGNPLVIDIVGMDVCLMSMAEICYELRDRTKILIGCESYSPASGWPFESILQSLEECANPEQVADFAAAQQNVEEEFAKRAVADFVDFYADYDLGGLSVDQSALNIRQVNRLKADVERLAEAMIEELENKETSEAFRAAVVLAHWDAQSYNGEQFVDIIDFCDCLQTRYTGTSLASLAEEVRESISENFVLRSCYSGRKYQYSYGVSIYFPWDKVALNYGENSFAVESGWINFLQKYTELTRRGPRGVEKGTELWKANLNPPIKVRKTEGRRTEGMGPGNEIYSMRNPPIIVRPSQCISEEKATGTASNLFFIT